MNDEYDYAFCKSCSEWHTHKPWCSWARPATNLPCLPVDQPTLEGKEAEVPMVRIQRKEVDES